MQWLISSTGTADDVTSPHAALAGDTRSKSPFLPSLQLNQALIDSDKLCHQHTQSNAVNTIHLKCLRCYTNM